MLFICFYQLHLPDSVLEETTLHLIDFNEIMCVLYHKLMEAKPEELRFMRNKEKKACIIISMYQQKLHLNIIRHIYVIYDSSGWLGSSFKKNKTK